jgi:hypothetical protein
LRTFWIGPIITIDLLQPIIEILLEEFIYSSAVSGVFYIEEKLRHRSFRDIGDHVWCDIMRTRGLVGDIVAGVFGKTVLISDAEMNSGSGKITDIGREGDSFEKFGCKICVRWGIAIGRPKNGQGNVSRGPSGDYLNQHEHS